MTHWHISFKKLRFIFIHEDSYSVKAFEQDINSSREMIAWICIKMLIWNIITLNSRANTFYIFGGNLNQTHKQKNA